MLSYRTAIHADGLAFADIIATEPLDVPVPSCPGWDLRALAEHLGYIHRWARLAAATARQPDPALIDAPPQDASALAAWVRVGVDALVDTFAAHDPTAPTWHPFPVPQVAAVWPRRQAHELAIHLWDAQAAVGPTTPIAPDRCADFVGEYFEVVVPRVIARDGRIPPTGTVQVRLVDADAVLLVASSVATPAPTLRFEPLAGAESGPNLKADGGIEGPAEDVLLALWGRRALAGAPLDGPAAEWLEFGGN